MNVNYLPGRPNDRILGADAIAYDCGIDGDDPYRLDLRWRADIFRRYPKPIRDHLARAYRDEYERQGRHGAAFYLACENARLSPGTIPGVTDFAAISEAAERNARDFKILSASESPSWALETFEPWIRSRGGNIPEGSSDSSKVARLCCSRWWRRTLHRRLVQSWERSAIDLGFVRRSAGMYASDFALRMRREQKVRSRNLLTMLEAVNELGDKIALSDLFEASVANPKVRRAELMVRLAGFEEVAAKRGDRGVFLTITCPSRMHAWPSYATRKNPRYDQTRPRAAQDYLCRLWSRIRAKLHRRDIAPYGFRVVEPHASGTPHWHLLLFVPPHRLEALCAICQAYALEDSPGEPGARRHRFRRTDFDRRKGTFTGYAAKYISKNIDGFGMTNAQGRLSAAHAAERVETWASTWRIRQFQQIGGPPVTVWRELRRLRDPVDDSVIEAARLAADQSSWVDYVFAQGGPDSSPCKALVAVARVWSDMPGQYGDPKGFTAFGVTSGDVTVQTRVHRWAIHFSGNRDLLHTGKPLVLSEASSAPPGRSPAGPALLRARAAGVPVSRGSSAAEEIH